MHPKIEEYIRVEREKRAAEARKRAVTLLGEAIRKWPAIKALLDSEALRLNQVGNLCGDGITEISIAEYGGLIHFGVLLPGGGLGGLYPDFLQALEVAAQFALKGREETCGNCRFFHRGEQGKTLSGECRRYPPKPLWPSVSVTDWCGEFAPRQGSAAQKREVDE